MNRIDFLGAPGVGKTTLYDELVRQRTRIDRWLIPVEAKVEIAKKKCLVENFGKKELLFSFFLKTGLFQQFHPSFTNLLLSKYQKETIWNQKDKYADFIEIALKGAAIPEKIPLRRLLGLTWFYSIVNDVIFLEHADVNNIVVFDESLSHKVYSIIESQEGCYENLTEEYFQYMPPPNVLIFCKANPKKIQHRIKQRENTNGKLIPGHRDLDVFSLFERIKIQCHVAEIGASVLRDRGVKVIEVDMEYTLDHNVHKVINLLRDLS